MAFVASTTSLSITKTVPDLVFKPLWLFLGDLAIAPNYRRLRTRTVILIYCAWMDENGLPATITFVWKPLQPRNLCQIRVFKEVRGVLRHVLLPLTTEGIEAQLIVYFSAVLTVRARPSLLSLCKACCYDRSKRCDSDIDWWRSKAHYPKDKVTLTRLFFHCPFCVRHSFQALDGGLYTNCNAAILRAQYEKRFHSLSGQIAVKNQICKRGKISRLCKSRRCDRNLLQKITSKRSLVVKPGALLNLRLNGFF